ncbi:unnamed protein product [Spirodela intermedia]|uniref:Ubiquitin-like domain-containing protein n=1 Tax=Spirodela intermedia TaxID=51605 RepID=A0A7I8LGW0_SPIIN|nr:unnamed protein product [Spirodela intermedia]
MDVTFETPEGRVFIIEVWFFATVQEMKEMIQKFHGFPVARQRLVFEGRVLEDHHNTEHYGILQDSRVRLFLEMPPEFSAERPALKAEEPVDQSEMPPRQLHSPSPSAKRLRVMVLPKCGTKKIAVEVNGWENVKELRRELIRLQEKQQVNLPAEGYFFIYRQNVMDEDRSFRWHDVRHGDTIEIFNGSVTSGS